MGFRHSNWVIFTFIQVTLISGLWAQSDNVYLDMTLEELFDVDVMVSASKRPEDLFEAPLSVTVIKQEDIIHSGATCIPEALRLAPGLIVREQSPGNFDVHIRGFDDVTTSFMTPHPTNTIMLVMIDNRIVYNYFSGGTFWESLPVDVNDVDKIEVVRGPASALFGPNAAAGVINIITKTAQKPGYSAHGRASTASDGSQFANISVGHGCNKSDFGISANYTRRDRVDKLYYAWLDREYIPMDNMSTLMFMGFDPETNEPIRLDQSGFDVNYSIDRSIYKYGLNGHYTYNFSEHTNVTVRSGFQESISQKAYYDNFSTPFSMYDSKSYYSEMVANYKGLYTQVSYLKGKHDNNFFWNSYDFSNLDVVTEYQFHFKNLYLRPGFSYRKSDYSGLLIDDEAWGENPHQEPNSNRIMETTSLSILADYMLANQVRLIGGLRLDHYSINDNPSFTYESGITYRFNKNNLFRLVYSRANRAPFMLDSFIGKNVRLMTWLGDYETGIPVILQFNPNTNTDYLTNRNIELGWRSKLSPKLDIDTQVFFSYLDDFLDMPTYSFDIDSVNYDIPIVVENLVYDNIDFRKARQFGISYTIGYQPTRNIDFKFYGMLQETDSIWDRQELLAYNLKVGDEFERMFGFRNYTPAQLDSAINETVKEKPGSTPRWYGGFMVNIQPVNRVNLNINGYYSGSQTFSGVSVNDEYYSKIAPYWVVNFKGSCRFWKNLSAFVNVRNMLGKHREYAFTDHIYDTVLFGFELLP